MKVYISQIKDGIGIIKAKDKNKASAILGVPKHQFLWQETTDSFFVSMAEVNKVTILRKTEETQKNIDDFIEKNI